MIKAQILPAVLLTFVLTILTGIVFPCVIWVFGQLFFSYQANGSLLSQGDRIIGSALIGQNFTSAKYFHPRPSAAGTGYDPLSSSGTNLGPTNKKLISGLTDDPATKDVDERYEGIEGLAKAYRKENGLDSHQLIPADAVTRSASGLDPHISPQNAMLQAMRVAKERGFTKEQVIQLIETNTEQRFLGIFGETRVNVLRLNLELDNVKEVLSAAKP